MREKDIKDIVIIGGGPGGYVAAIHAAHLGAEVAIVEKNKLGGTCINQGCIPTKTFASSAETLLEMRRANEFGINADNITVNFRKIQDRVNNVVDRLVSGIEQLMEINRISVCRGTGCILSPNLVKVNDEEILTKKIIIATGSKPIMLHIPGLDLPGVLNTDDILNLQELPESLVIIGGSYVGIEFATIFAALGTKVTIVERLPALIENVDEEIGQRFTRILPKLGIKVYTGAKVKAIKKEGTALRLFWDTEEGEHWSEGQMVLKATGREPYTGGLALSELGIGTDGSPIKVNERLETNVTDVYAIGDVLGKNMLAHVASYEGEIAAENALGRTRKVDYRAVPSCVFTQPELASVGITEKEARNSGIPYQVSKFPFAACGRAVTMGNTIGMVKIICSAGSGTVLGMHIMGPHASDLIAEGALAIQTGATARDIANTIHAHPTLSEAVREAAMGQLDGAIHFRKI